MFLSFFLAEPPGMWNLSSLTTGVKPESSCNEGNPGLIPGSGRSPGEGNGNPLQYSHLENSMDRGAMRSHRVRHDWTTNIFTFLSVSLWWKPSLNDWPPGKSLTGHYESMEHVWETMAVDPGHVISLLWGLWGLNFSKSGSWLLACWNIFNPSWYEVSTVGDLGSFLYLVNSTSWWLSNLCVGLEWTWILILTWLGRRI